MKNEITCVFNLAVNDGQFPAFKELVSRVVEATSKEPGTLSYVYSVSDDQKPHISSSVIVSRIW